MLRLLWLVPALPLLGFLVLALAGRRLPPFLCAGVGVATVGAAAALALAVAVAFLGEPPPGGVFVQPLWRWLAIGEFQVEAALYLDGLALVMMLVISGVGFLIHLYASEFMAGEEGYGRFFAYMNLFVAAMLLLVLAGDLLFLYLGWEAVGLCSYLLIGFWYRDGANGVAAQKAFIVTRSGDTALLIALLLLATQLGTLEIQGVMAQARADWAPGSGVAVVAAALLLTSALGKSAQLPLQVWLPDAMAGPTPVSALIHAATMVTAGVYLIARTHGLFLLAPAVLTVVGVIGAATLLLAAVSALNQRDIKRVLAYSTISQIGYMFLALGVGAWSAAIFHFMTHAFFKALLFLGAGSVILAFHHEHDIFRMGGLRRRLPLTFWSFLAGAASLAALPLITAGFYSKDRILAAAWAAGGGGVLLWLAAMAGAFLTALYIFRLLFVVFYGEPSREPERRLGWRMAAPLLLLALLSLAGGFIDLPPALGGEALLSGLLAPVLPRGPVAEGWSEALHPILAGLLALAGVFLADRLYRLERPAAARTGPLLWLGDRAARGWGFDALYHRLLVRPFQKLTAANRADVADRLPWGIVGLSRILHRWLGATQTGRARAYAAVIAAGTVVLVALAVSA